MLDTSKMFVPVDQIPDPMSVMINGIRFTQTGWGSDGKTINEVRYGMVGDNSVYVTFSKRG